MTIERIRWESFRSFKDSGWVDLAPLTVIVGANASGKTSLIAPLLMLKQTVESRDASLPLKTKGRYFNAGAYADFIFAHDVKRELALHVAFQSSNSASPSEIPNLFVAPPSELELRFRDEGEWDVPELNSWRTSDAYGRRLLERVLQKSGKYSLLGLDLPTDEKTKQWTNTIRDSTPEGFLFTPDSVFADMYRQTRAKTRTPAEALEVSLGPAHQIYLSVVGFVAAQVRNATEGLAYLGPVRDKPRRVYELGGEIPFSVGAGGQFAPEIIASATEDLTSHINRWIEAFEFGSRIYCDELGSDVFSLMLQRAKGSANVNVADTGFGLSQVLPLIVQGYYSDTDDLLVAEQPEIHLNPRLQGVLGDLLVDIVGRGVRVLLETHSEHLILRLRRLIAQGAIKASDVALYFVEREKNESTIRRIQLDRVGHIPNGSWPRGFFEDGLAESLALVEAQSKAAHRDK